MSDDDDRRYWRPRRFDDWEHEPGDPALIELSPSDGEHPRGRGPLIIIGAVLLLAALGAGFVIGSGALDSPAAADVSPDATPSEPMPSASDELTASLPAVSSPSTSLAPSPLMPIPTPIEVTIREGLLPPGSVLLVTGDELRLRAEPSLSGQIVTEMDVGKPAYVASSITAGPVLADGYEWYQIEYAGGRELWPYQDVVPDQVQMGWAAAGNETQRFVRVADVNCYDRIASLQSIAAMTDWERLVCFAGQRITIEGTFGLSDPAPAAGIEPHWLADIEAHAAMNASGNFYPFVRIAMPPGFEPPPQGSIIRASLHVDDPAASSCALAPGADGTDRAYDAEAVRVYCREQLVIDSFEVLGTDPLAAQ